MRHLVFMVGVLWAFPALAQGKVARVAVFGIEDTSGKLTQAERQHLTEYLGSKIAEGGFFRVIPSGQLKQRLGAQRKESYKACYDQQCQIDIGRELAANKSLSTKIAKLGDQCIVMCTLFDLRRAVTDASASQRGECKVGSLVGAIEKLADKLRAQVGRKGVKKAPRPLAAALLPTKGTLSVRSEPPGALVLVDGKPAGVAPISVPVAPGRHTIRLEKEGRRSSKRTVKVQSGKTMTLAVKLPSLVPASAPPPTPAPLPKPKVAPLSTPPPAPKPAPEEQAPLQAKRRSKTIWAWTTLGVAGALAATAAVMYGIGLSSGSSAYDEYSALDGTSPGDYFDEKWSHVESAETKVTVGHVAIGAAAATLGLSLYFFLTRPSVEEATGASPTAALVPMDDGVAFSIAGRFSAGGGR